MRAEHPNTRHFPAVLALLALSLLQLPAIAQTADAAKSCAIADLRKQLVPHFAQCPNNLMTLVIAYNPGGNTDTVGRFYQSYLESIASDSGAAAPAFSTMIESKPGASGEIGSRYVAEADAKIAACRLLVAQSNQLTTNELGVPNAINPDTDLKLISMLAEAPLVLAVNAQTSPHKTLADLQKYLKSGGERNFYGSNGNFATDHLAVETMLAHMGARGTHVPFTGSGPMIQSLLSGSERGVDFVLVSAGLIRAYLLDGRLRALGVARPGPLAMPRGAGQPDLVIEPIAKLVPEFQSASMWVALTGGRNMPDGLGVAMERTAQCFAQAPKARALAGEMVFELGGSRNALRNRMRAETAEARLRFANSPVAQGQRRQ
jgi:tripartite-type tricarboxylate transporter receptor subunit TctC